MRFEDIYIGDVLRIKEWDELVEEFSSNEGRDYIDVPFGFISDMKFLCGKQFTVKSLNEDTGEIHSYEKVECMQNEHTSNPDDEFCWWSISAEMLSPAINSDCSNIQEISVEELFDVLV